MKRTRTNSIILTTADGAKYEVTKIGASQHFMSLQVPHIEMDIEEANFEIGEVITVQNMWDNSVFISKYHITAIEER